MTRPSDPARFPVPTHPALWPAQRREVPYFDGFAGLFDRFTRIWDSIDPRFTTWLTDHLSTGGGGRALDLGCGAGRHSLLLADRYTNVLAVDVSAPMLDLARVARARPNIAYQHRSVLQVTPDLDGLFDLVLSVHTLHHVGPPDRVLPQVRSLVAPGGTAVIADIIDPGGWTNTAFHIDRAFAQARAVYEYTADDTAASDVLGLLLHPDWLTQAFTDIPLTREAFRRHYTDVFPGVTIVEDLHPLMAGAVWHNHHSDHAGAGQWP